MFAQEIPQKISYQGKLLENGNPVTGTKSITFTIDTWTETHPGVQVTDGLYSVTLGETTPIPTSIFDNSSTLSLQISVAGIDLTPQTDILSVPYAYKAEKAVTAENVPTNVSELTNDAGYITSPNDADADPSNELQTLSISSNDLSISSGNTVTLPSSGGFTLPYSGTYGGSSDAFKITNTGTGKIGFFEITNPANTANVQYLRSNGIGTILRIVNDGSGDLINITNDGSAGRGIYIKQNANADGIYISNNGTGYAGYFDGNVQVTGNLSKGGGSFKIDHPLDPENKYLYHSFVESPDMLNVYNGNIILDNNGEAIVELPEWFKALNKDFRYQLTPVGASMPNLYIKEKISDNHFKIAGGVSGKEVSWQVTGIRQDPYANQHRIQVEVEKSAKEKGHYLHYKAYEQPIEKSMKVVKDPELLEKLKEHNNK